MKDQRKAEGIAAERVQLLSPLLAEGLDPAKAREMKARICEQSKQGFPSGHFVGIWRSIAMRVLGG